MILEALTLSMLLTTTPTVTPTPRAPDAVVEAGLKQKSHSNPNKRVKQDRQPPRASKPRNQG